MIGQGGFSFGISAGGSGLEVRKNTMRFHSTGFIGNGGLIEENEASDNTGGDGFQILGNGSVIRGNKALRNGENGLGEGNVVESNDASKNRNGVDVIGGGNKGKKNDFAQCEIDGNACTK